MNRPIIERFFKFLEDSYEKDECWNWKGWVNEDGYGRKHFDGVNYLVHRFSYELFVGEIPKGFEVDHLCNNPSCVNPYHLEAKSHIDNCLRGRNHYREQTKCNRGHKYTDESVKIYVRPDGQIERICKMCKKENNDHYNGLKKMVMLQ